MANLIVSIIILAIIVLSIAKIVSEKRKGVKCVGCSQGGSCSSKKQAKHQHQVKQFNIKKII